MDPWVFEHRPWVTDVGWPITRRGPRRVLPRRERGRGAADRPDRLAVGLVVLAHAAAEVGLPGAARQRRRDRRDVPLQPADALRHAVPARAARGAQRHRRARRERVGAAHRRRGRARDRGSGRDARRQSLHRRRATRGGRGRRARSAAAAVAVGLDAARRARATTTISSAATSWITSRARSERSKCATLPKGYMGGVHRQRARGARAHRRRDAARGAARLRGHVRRRRRRRREVRRRRTGVTAGAVGSCARASRAARRTRSTCSCTRSRSRRPRAGSCSATNTTRSGSAGSSCSTAARPRSTRSIRRTLELFARELGRAGAGADAHRPRRHLQDAPRDPDGRVPPHGHDAHGRRSRSRVWSTRICACTASTTSTSRRARCSRPSASRTRRSRSSRSTLRLADHLKAKLA